MGSTYREYTLDELGFIGRGKSKHRPRNDPSLFGGKYPFIQTGDVRGANLYITEFNETYNDVGLAQSQLWDKGTLLITIAANIAETAVLDIDACFPDSIVGFIPDESKVNAFYVKYYIDYIKQEMQSISQGTTQDNLSLEKLRTFKFKVPEKSKVDEITKILLSYDDLIENNNRRIAILETIAQNLYREWFINFRFPGHKQAQWRETPQGKIPLDWEFRKLKNVCNLTMGQSPKSEFYNEEGEGIPFFQGVRDFGTRFPTTRVWCTKPTRFAQKSDILFSVRAPVGRLNIASFDLSIGRGLCAINHKKGYQAFLYEQIKSIFTKEDMIGGGTIFNSVTKADMESILLIVPTEEVMKQAEVILQPVFKKINNLSLKNQNLTQQRDMLLPKLIQ